MYSSTCFLVSICMPFYWVYPGSGIAESYGRHIFGFSSMKHHWSSNGFTLQRKNFGFCCAHKKLLSSSSLLLVTFTHIHICGILLHEIYMLFPGLKKLNSLSLIKPSSKNKAWKCCIKTFTRLLFSLLTTMTENCFNFLQYSIQRVLTIYLTFLKSCRVPFLNHTRLYFSPFTF